MMDLDNTDISTAETEANPKDHYWALDPPEKLAKHLTWRRDDFWSFLHQSRFYERVMRNWQYYHGLYFDGKWDTGMELKIAGPQKEKLLIACNHFRAAIQMLINYTTQNRPAWDCRAMNSDSRSLRQAEIGNQVLDYVMEAKGCEEHLHRVCEHAIVLTTGYIRAVWDQYAGKEIDGDPMTGELMYEGDVVIDTPTIFDVIFDYSVKHWKENKWVLVRSRKSKWELCERYFDKREQILEAVESEEERDLHYFTQVGAIRPNSDMVDYWEFYHLNSPELPGGRRFCFLGPDLWLEDQDYDIPGLPIHRLVPSEYLLTPLGYSPGFDLQGPQEALNAELSTILTNHAALGPTKIWFKQGDTINYAALETGVKVIQSDQEPKPINFTQTPAEFFEMVKILEKENEMLSGINSVAKGQPEASLRSGTALALIDQKAMQFASPLIQGYYTILSDFGTGILLNYKRHADSPRFLYIAGRNKRVHMKAFSGEELSLVDRVVVQAGNPLQRTIAGRTAIAEQLLTTGLIKTPEEYLTVLNTGELKPLTEATDSEVTLCQEENEALRDGLPARAFITNNHALHIKKHQAIFDSPDMYADTNLVLLVQSHIMEHVQLMMDPMSQMIGTILGYPNPLMMMMPSQPAEKGQASQPKKPGGPNGVGAASPQAQGMGNEMTQTAALEGAQLQ